MIRFMGFATGAAVAVGFMLFLFGAPQAPEAELEVRAEVDVDPAPEPAPTALPEVVAEATEPAPATAGPEDASLATPVEPAVGAAPEPVARLASQSPTTHHRATCSGTHSGARSEAALQPTAL